MLCAKCIKNVRVGDNNGGNTLEEALEGVLSAGSVSPQFAGSMLEAMIPQARKGGACGGCISFLNSIRSKLSEFPT